MQLCTDCGERAATVYVVTGTEYADVVYDNGPGPDAAAQPEVPADAASPSEEDPGPTLCDPCARRRWDARRPPGAPARDAMFERLARIPPARD